MDTVRAVTEDQRLEFAVNLFYDRILTDPILGVFFTNVDLSALNRKQYWLLAALKMGASPDTANYLRKVHKPLVQKLGLKTEHFVRFMTLLKQSMNDEGVAADKRDIILRNAEKLRAAILGHPF